MEKRILVAMSGGVDSSVAALLLQKQGWEVCGATFQLFEGEKESNVQDAKAVCDQLGIPHKVLDYRRDFEQNVINYFVNAYQSGETPNPCVMCNRTIKFGRFAEDAQRFGFPYISTGHYARVYYDEKQNRYGLRKASDGKKDQSYVLYHLNQQQLAMLVLPLSDYSKLEIREFAAQVKLSVTSKSDSQDICFIPDKDYVSFLERYTGQSCPEGVFVDDSGQILGRHKGYLRYTIGQRKGLGISFGEHRYVTHVDSVSNTITLSDAQSLFHNLLEATGLSMMIPWDGTPLPVQAKIRYAHTPAPATIEKLGEKRVRVLFDTPQRAITPGQAVVFYQGDEVLGGATICRVDSAIK